MESLKKLYNIGFGPSSSHTMGPFNACVYFLNRLDNADHYLVTLYGSLALTGKGHLTDYIIYQAFKNRNIEIKFDVETKTIHPNTMDILAFDKDNNLLLEKRFFSVGGGKIIVKVERNKEQNQVYKFNSFDEIKTYCLNNNLSLPEFVKKFDDSDIEIYLQKAFEVMKNSINRGLNTQGFLPGKLKVERKAKYLIEKIDSDNIKLQKISAYAYAVSEENASGNIICTAPTCGASGVLPAILYYYYNDLKKDIKEIINALAVAGIIGNVIKTNASISGAKAGCQSEIGSACSMAAAAVSYLENMNIEQIEYAAEIAMEHHLGLTCDPVLGLVQIPCIERNAVAALRALEASFLSKHLFGSRKISFDLVVKTMYETGKDLAKKYKETSTGGLAKNYFNEHKENKNEKK